jgi:Ca-activated chloride channel homolog
MDQRATGRLALTFRVKSEVPIVEMHSPSHPDSFAISRHTQHFHEASLEATGGELSRDLVIDYKLARPRTGLDLITSRPAGEDGYFLLTLTAGEELSELSQPMDYVFVLDISGSMSNDQKLALSTRSIGAFIDQLGEEDRFEIISFNRQPTMMFNGLRKADQDNKLQGLSFLRAQHARGGTVLSPAIHAAYRYGEADRRLNVVILSDGMTEVGERRELLGLMRQRPANARVFAVGVGNEVDRPLLQQMAHDAGGLAAFVSHGADFDRQAQAFRRKLTRPAAENVSIRITGVDAYDLVPGDDLPNLYHGSPIRVFGRYRGSGDARVTLGGTVLGQQIEKTVSMTFPLADGGNPEIERMWAQHRVQELLAQADRTGSRSAVIDQIVRLGEGYSIATEYTSFIVLENDAEYQRWKIDRRNSLRLARDRAKAQALDQQLADLRQRAAEALGPPPQHGDVLASAQPAASPARPNPQPTSRGVDLNIGGGRGAGALDPLTVAMAMTLGAAAGMSWRRTRSVPRRS